MSRRQPRSVLILCVDRDDDVGEVTGARTPVVGRDEVARVAMEFATRRPEDSDSNALFAALRLYDETKQSGSFSDVEIALVAGHRDEGLKADLKISKELDELLSRRSFDGAILVSDGPTDEAVLPLVQSKLPVLSVQRVVVQQSRGVEESFILFIRYARRLFEEERYKKYALGVPGALISMYILLQLTLPAYAWPLILASIGVAMIVKGFSLDVQLARMYASSPLLFTAVIASGLIAALAVVTGLSSVAAMGGVEWVKAVGYFLLASVGEQVIVLDLLVTAALLPFVAKALHALLGGGGFRAEEVGAVALIIALRQVVYEYSRLLVGAGSILMLLAWTLAALLVLSLLAALLPLMRRPVGRA